jgi:glucokinase
VVGVDLGGTSAKAALVTPGLELLAREEEPTDLDSQAELLDALVALVERVRGGGEVAAVGFGLPSQIDQRAGLVADSTNVPLEDLDFAGEMRRRLGLPVAIENDGNVACLAESRLGAAAGSRHVVMLTLGTGVGGGVLIDGRIFHGSSGVGGELGHVVVDPDGPPCQGHCPNRGCLEVLASAGALVATACRIAQRRGGGALDRADGITARLVIDEALRGDAEACEAVAATGRYVGIALAGFVNVFNPEVVVIGGGLCSAGDVLLEPAVAEMRRRVLRVAGSQVRVATAELGNVAGVLGAAALVLPEP